MDMMPEMRKLTVAVARLSTDETQPANTPNSAAIIAVNAALSRGCPLPIIVADVRGVDTIGDDAAMDAAEHLVVTLHVPEAWASSALALSPGGA